MEEFLSQNAILFELRDQFQDPLTPDELFDLFHDEEGVQLGPLTSMKNGQVVVYGCDLLRTDEHVRAALDEVRSAGATVWGRPDDRGTQALLDYFEKEDIPVVLKDVREEPLSREDLWNLLYMPREGILRSPLTVVDGQVVLGFDLDRLRGALARDA